MYTDFLEQPICEGDEIVYAQSAYGGGAQLKRARILKIVPLIPHRDHPTRGTREVFMREDQANIARPTDFVNDLYADPAKRYVIQIMKEKWRSQTQGGPAPQKYTIPQSQHIFKVPVQS